MRYSTGLHTSFMYVASIQVHPFLIKLLRASVKKGRICHSTDLCTHLSQKRTERTSDF